MDKSGRKKKIGIVGGTFDPVHYGHLVLAETARERLHLHRVMFIPAGVPPHKQRHEITDVEMRFRMIELAVAGNDFFCASRIEIDKQGISYSVETLRSLKKNHPEAEFYFLVGSDAIPELKTWKRIKEIFSLAHFVIARRPNFDTSVFPEDAVLLEGHFPDISSRVIRQRVREGVSIKGLVPEAVARFIKEHNLYR